MEEKAQKYLNSQYVDYGDLNEKAEEQIKQAFIDGMKEQLRIGVVNKSFYCYDKDCLGRSKCVDQCKKCSYEEKGEQ